MSELTERIENLTPEIAGILLPIADRVDLNALGEIVGKCEVLVSASMPEIALTVAQGFRAQAIVWELEKQKRLQEIKKKQKEEEEEAKRFSNWEVMTQESNLPFLAYGKIKGTSGNLPSNSEFSLMSDTVIKYLIIGDALSGKTVSTRYATFSLDSTILTKITDEKGNVIVYVNLTSQYVKKHQSVCDSAFAIMHSEESSSEEKRIARKRYNANIASIEALSKEIENGLSHKRAITFTQEEIGANLDIKLALSHIESLPIES